MSGGPEVAYTLPSGRRVTLTTPTVGDQEQLRRQLLEQYKAEPNALSRVVYELGLTLPKACLQADSGATNGALDPDARYRCQDWPLSDMLAYLAFYDALIGVEEADAEAAREAAKAFRAGLRGSA